jgi:hypothetical protein
MAVLAVANRSTDGCSLSGGENPVIAILGQCRDGTAASAKHRSSPNLPRICSGGRDLAR